MGGKRQGERRICLRALHQERMLHLQKTERKPVKLCSGEYSGKTVLKEFRGSAHKGFGGPHEGCKIMGSH